MKCRTCSDPRRAEIDLALQTRTVHSVATQYDLPSTTVRNHLTRHVLGKRPARTQAPPRASLEPGLEELLETLKSRIRTAARRKDFANLPSLAREFRRSLEDVRELEVREEAAADGPSPFRNVRVKMAVAELLEIIGKLAPEKLPAVQALNERYTRQRDPVSAETKAELARLFGPWK